MKNRFNKQLSKLDRSQEGVTSIEYALIAGLIAMAIIAGVRVAGQGANSAINNAGTSLINNAP